MKRTANEPGVRPGKEIRVHLTGLNADVPKQCFDDLFNTVIHLVRSI